MAESSPLPTVTDMLINVDDVLKNKDIQKIYGNGFTIGISLVDAQVVIQLGATPIGVLVMPHTSLKGLHKALSEAIPIIEKGLGRPLLDLQQTDEMWRANLNPNK